MLFRLAQKEVAPIDSVALATPAARLESAILLRPAHHHHFLADFGPAEVRPKVPIKLPAAAIDPIALSSE